MPLCFKELVFLASHFVIISSVKRSVKYDGPPGLGGNKIACAAMNADPSFMAVRMHEATGACEGLTWDTWGSNRTYETGYAYFEKKMTTEVFDPPILVQNSSTTMWLIPGVFGNGGRIDVYVTHMSSTDKYMIRVMDVTSETYDLKSGPKERVIVNFVPIRSEDKVVFTTCTPQQWWQNQGSVSPDPFTDGLEAKISFVPDATNITIYIDDNQVTSYAYPYISNPNDSKQLRFEMEGPSTIELSKIVFVGI